MDLGITGRRALVTGASSGLGLSTARALAANGVSVVISSRSLDRLEAAAATIVPTGGAQVHVAVADV
ncbi:MAG: SDR family NAD(P)-dependent oxidoreductase, partial [Ilumatobacteraceae bacterium]